MVLFLLYQFIGFLFLFLALFALACTSSMMLSIIGENRYACLVPDLRKKALSLTINYDVAVGIFVDVPYHVKEVSFCI